MSSVVAHYWHRNFRNILEIWSGHEKPTALQQINVIRLCTTDTYAELTLSFRIISHRIVVSLCISWNGAAQKMMIAGESMKKIFVIFLHFHLVNRIWCTLHIVNLLLRWAQNDNKMNKIRSPTDADNRFIVVSPGERTKHHLTPYLTKLISARVCVCVWASISARWWFLVPWSAWKDERRTSYTCTYRTERRRKEQLRKVLSVGLPFDGSRIDRRTHKFLCVYSFAAGDDWTHSIFVHAMMLSSAIHCCCLEDCVWCGGRRNGNSPEIDTCVQLNASCCSCRCRLLPSFNSLEIVA